jgi:hypothetical protein
LYYSSSGLLTNRRELIPLLFTLLQTGVSYLHSIMSTSSDVVNDTSSTHAPIDDGRGTAGVNQDLRNLQDTDE